MIHRMALSRRQLLATVGVAAAGICRVPPSPSVPNAYPTGSAGNLFPQELFVIRDILTECDGGVRWGGDDKNHPKECHFQIDVPPGDAPLRSLGAKIRGWQGKLGQGAGAPVDPAASIRRCAAKALELRQKRS